MSDWNFSYFRKIFCLLFLRSEKCVNGSESDNMILLVDRLYRIRLPKTPQRIRGWLTPKARENIKSKLDVTSVNQFIALWGRFNDLCATWKWKKSIVYIQHITENKNNRRECWGEAKRWVSPSLLVEGTWHRVTPSIRAAQLTVDESSALQSSAESRVDEKIFASRFSADSRLLVFVVGSPGKRRTRFAVVVFCALLSHARFDEPNK